MDGQKDDLGRYSLTRMHAEGGIGQVWVARDHQLSRDVALKRLQPSKAADQAIRARFLREAWVTGQLQHPGVVPLYELSDGSGGDEPFYTMQLIKGRTMTMAAREYCRMRQSGLAHQLELQQLIGAFLGVCHVVAYAHSRGVIHRDLKGQNVVLGDFGEVMVLDWGLAKAANLPEPELQPASSDDGNGPSRGTEPNDLAGMNTVQGMIMGTPGFMAPEQAMGRLDLVGPRSDVYGLGAILYEILTAEPPFAGSKHEVLRKVVSEDPTPPRQRLPGIPRALDGICMKCLARNPEDRYDSAADLAKDVQRYLAGEPVTAYAEPWTVCLRRWAGRHRTLVTATAAALVVATVCLAVGAFFLNLAKARETVERNKAITNFKLALDTVERFFTRVGDDQRLKAHGLEKLRRDLLLEAKNFYETLDRDDGRIPRVGAERGWSYLRLAKITEELGEHAEVVGLAQTAQSIFEGLLISQPSSPEYLEGLARALDLMGGGCQENNQLAEARAAYDRSVATWEQITRDHQATPENRHRTAVALNRLGRFLQITLNEVPESEAVLARSLAVCERLVAEHPKTDAYRETQAVALMYLGFSLSFRDFDKASGPLDRALEIQTDLAARHPDSLEQQSQLVETCLFVASAYSNARKLDRARKVNQNILRISERLAHEHPDVPLFAENFAMIQGLCAIDAAVSGDHVAAARAAEKGLTSAPKSGMAQLYGACAYAAASQSASRDPALLGPDRTARVVQYQDRAMELLRSAKATGLFAQPYFSKGLPTDPDLAPLRARKDFQEFLDGLKRSAPR